MAVYVDTMRAAFKGMIMCHMFADSHEELMAMAKRLELKPEWIQDPFTYREHFDISRTKRDKALRLGAKEISFRECGELLRLRRERQPINSC